MESVLEGFFGANIFISLFSSGFLQYLWGMINTLQIIVLSALFDLNEPINAEEVTLMILKLRSLDFMQTEEIYEVFGFRETEAFNSEANFEGEIESKYDNAGYDSSNFFLLIGPILLIVVSAIVYTVCKLVTKLIVRPCGDNFCTRFFRRRIEFSAITIRFLLESSFELGLSAMITVKMMSSENFDTFWESVSTSCAFVTLVCLSIAPLALIRITKTYVGEVLGMQDETQHRHYEMLGSYRPNRRSMLYSIVFFLRRYTVILVLTMLPGNALAQILTTMLSTMVVIAYVGGIRPHANSNVNRQEIINEITVLVASYPLLFFTKWVWDMDMRLNAGWFLIACIILNCLFNMTILLFAMLWAYKKKLKF